MKIFLEIVRDLTIMMIHSILATVAVLLFFLIFGGIPQLIETILK